MLAAQQRWRGTRTGLSAIPPWLDAWPGCVVPRRAWLIPPGGTQWPPRDFGPGLSPMAPIPSSEAGLQSVVSCQWENIRHPALPPGGDAAAQAHGGAGELDGGEVGGRQAGGRDKFHVLVRARGTLMRVPARFPASAMTACPSRPRSCSRRWREARRWHPPMPRWP